MELSTPNKNWSPRSAKRLREEFPTTRFNFTQPIIDSVTEDTNGTSANLAVEFSGPDSDVLLDLAAQTVELLRASPRRRGREHRAGRAAAATRDPARPRRCARYNVRIDDVNQLINTALGGEPVGTLYEGERRFDIVAQVRPRAACSSPEAIGRLPVYNRRRRADSAVRRWPNSSLADGQTMIARENSRRRITVRCDIVGRDQGGFVAEAQAAFSPRRCTVPAGYRVRWLGMFENLERAPRHFLIVIPITIAHDLSCCWWSTFGSQRAALLVLLSVPFAFVGGVAGALRSRHAPQRLDRRRLRGPVRRLDHERRADGAVDHHACAAKGLTLDEAIVPGAPKPPAADPDDVARRHPRPAAGVARRPASAPTCSGRWRRSSSGACSARSC